MLQTGIFDGYNSILLFWSLEPLNFGHCFEFPYSDFGFIPVPYGNAAAGTGTQAVKPQVQPVDSLLEVT